MASKYKLTVKIDEAALKRAVGHGDGMQQVLSSKVDEITNRANSMSAGFRTGLFYRDHKSPPVGNTQPKYGGSVQLGSKGWVGLVRPKNYAAMKDNHLHNTLLKSKRG